MSVVVAQVPIGWDVDANLRTVTEVLDEARAGDVVVFPEGMVSGYDDDLTPLDGLAPATIDHAVARVEQLARQHLAAQGAQVFFYLTNAANTREPQGVWRSHLVSRAAENQRFLVSANVAHPDQHCPSMVVSPRGEVPAELPAGRTDVLRQVVDLDATSGWYLGQRRQDVIALSYRRS